MRIWAIVAALPLVSLAACGGAGPESAGSIAPVAGTGNGGDGSGGTGGGVTGGTATPTPTTPTPTSFLSAVTAETTFNAYGGAHSITTTDGAELYEGNASTMATPAGTITYSPRDGIFSIAFTDAKAGTTTTTRFQDPAHRSDFNPMNTPSLEAPNLDGFN